MQDTNNASPAAPLNEPRIFEPAAVKPPAYGSGLIEIMTRLDSQADELTEARREIDRFRANGYGDSHIVELDPRCVSYGAWAHHAIDDWQAASFTAIKESIARGSGNLQPIKVRPANALTAFQALSGERPAEFELIFGSARHRACLELGIQVLAIVECVSDKELVRQSVTEITFDRRWRPWKLGAAIRGAIDAGIFPSYRRAADELGLSVSEVSAVLGLTDLPLPVRLSFGRHELQLRQVMKLRIAFEINPDLLIRNARTLDFSRCRSASGVLAILLRTAP